MLTYMLSTPELFVIYVPRALPAVLERVRGWKTEAPELKELCEEFIRRHDKYVVTPAATSVATSVATPAVAEDEDPCAV